MAWDRQITIKTAHELELMRQAGRINAEALAAARSAIRPGATTADINAAAEEVLRKHGVYSPFKNYPGPYPYPASTNVSVNEELVHGIPGKRKLKEGEGRVLKLLSGLMMLGLGLVLLFAPEALSHPLTALALILAVLAVTALVVWLAGGLTGGPQQDASRIVE